MNATKTIKDAGFYYNAGFRAAYDETPKPRVPAEFKTAFRRGWEDGIAKATREEFGS